MRSRHRRNPPKPSVRAPSRRLPRASSRLLPGSSAERAPTRCFHRSLPGWISSVVWSVTAARWAFARQFPAAPPRQSARRRTRRRPKPRPPLLPRSRTSEVATSCGALLAEDRKDWQPLGARQTWRALAPLGAALLPWRRRDGPRFRVAQIHCSRARASPPHPLHDVPRLFLDSAEPRGALGPAQAPG